MERVSFLQDNNEAAINEGAINAVILAEGKPNTTLKPALWQFETMDDGSGQLWRKRASSRHEQITAFDNSCNVAFIYAGQSHDDEHFAICLQYIGGRLPRRNAGKRADGLKELSVELLRSR
jgi:hypothetical protein